MPIIVIQHADIGGPGRLGTALLDQAHALRVVRIDRGEPLPPDLDDVQGVLALGGPQSVVDNIPWFADEIAFLRQSHHQGLPTIGICLGAQLLAKAIGGECGRMDKSEIGFEPVRVEIPGQTDSMLAGVPWTSHQFEIHNDEITKLPAGATRLMTNDACAIQAFRAGLRSYGFQFHLEFDLETILDVCDEAAPLLEQAGVTKASIREQIDEHYARFDEVASRLCNNLVTLCFPFESLTAV